MIGCDYRPSSEALKKATIQGILDAGIDVIDLGMTGTEEVYFATSHYGAIGGIEVTASHNPINYNGLKLVREQSNPLARIPAWQTFNKSQKRRVQSGSQ